MSIRPAGPEAAAWLLATLARLKPRSTNASNAACSAARANPWITLDGIRGGEGNVISKLPNRAVHPSIAWVKNSRLLASNGRVTTQSPPAASIIAIADDYGYDQVIIIARAVDQGEHMTTYGKNKVHCEIAARCGDFLKYKVMGWHKEVATS